MSLDLSLLTRQVLRNCDVSDARHAGMFSICGLALRLRDLFKWERGLRPWEEGDPTEVLDWIGAREEHWETLAQSDYEPLTVDGREVDPFDAETVNAALLASGHCYGAGYARGLKPVFFVAEVADQREIEGCRVITLGRELARDLLTLPAVSQGRVVLLRRDSAARALWDQIAFVTPSARRAMEAALDACGIADHRPPAVRRDFDRLLRVQEQLHLRHELGEIHETGFPRDLWQEIVAAFPLTRVELVMRRIKDLLADTHALGPLRRFCDARSTAGIALYMAESDRAARALFPGLAEAFEGLLRGGAWEGVEQAVAHGRRTAQAHAAALVRAYADGPSRLAAVVEERFGAVLGRLPQETD